jgi:hypothetical protein
MCSLFRFALISALALAPMLGCSGDGGPCSGDACNDGDACTEDICDPADGSCDHTLVMCDDDNACTNDACDPADGKCDYAPVVCDDDNACTEDTCDPAAGRCDYTPVVVCDDDNVCSQNLCNPADGMCEYPPIPSLPATECDFGDLPGLCLEGVCVGACEVPEPCREIECYVAVCDPNDGWCDYTPAEVGAPCAGGGGHCCPGQICWAAGLVCPDNP